MIWFGSSSSFLFGRLSHGIFLPCNFISFHFGFFLSFPLRMFFFFFIQLINYNGLWLSSQCIENCNRKIESTHIILSLFWAFHTIRAVTKIYMREYAESIGRIRIEKCPTIYQRRVSPFIIIVIITMYLLDREKTAFILSQSETSFASLLFIFISRLFFFAARFVRVSYDLDFILILLRIKCFKSKKE